MAVGRLTLSSKNEWNRSRMCWPQRNITASQRNQYPSGGERKRRCNIQQSEQGKNSPYDGTKCDKYKIVAFMNYTTLNFLTSKLILCHPNTRNKSSKTKIQTFWLSMGGFHLSSVFIIEKSKGILIHQSAINSFSLAVILIYHRSDIYETIY